MGIISASKLNNVSIPILPHKGPFIDHACTNPPMVLSLLDWPGDCLSDPGPDVLTTDHNDSIQTPASTRAMQTSPLGFFFWDQLSTLTAFIGKNKNITRMYVYCNIVYTYNVKNILFDVKKSKEGHFS